MRAADASAAHGTQVTLRVAAGAAWEAAFAHPRVPDPLSNVFAEAVRATDASAAHGTGVTLRVAVDAAWEATFAHPRVPDPLANAFAEAVRAADVSAAHGTGVTLRVAASAAWEAAFAHPHVPDPLANAFAQALCAADASAAHGIGVTLRVAVNADITHAKSIYILIIMAHRLIALVLLNDPGNYKLKHLQGSATITSTIICRARGPPARSQPAALVVVGPAARPAAAGAEAAAARLPANIRARILAIPTGSFRSTPFISQINSIDPSIRALNALSLPLVLRRSTVGLRTSFPPERSAIERGTRSLS